MLDHLPGLRRQETLRGNWELRTEDPQSTQGEVPTSKPRPYEYYQPETAAECYLEPCPSTWGDSRHNLADFDMFLKNSYKKKKKKKQSSV